MRWGNEPHLSNIACFPVSAVFSFTLLITSVCLEEKGHLVSHGRQGCCQSLLGRPMACFSWYYLVSPSSASLQSQRPLNALQIYKYSPSVLNAICCWSFLFEFEVLAVVVQKHQWPLHCGSQFVCLCASQSKQGVCGTWVNCKWGTMCALQNCSVAGSAIMVLRSFVCQFIWVELPRFVPNRSFSGEVHLVLVGCYPDNPACGLRILIPPVCQHHWFSQWFASVVNCSHCIPLPMTGRIKENTICALIPLSFFLWPS